MKKLRKLDWWLDQTCWFPLALRLKRFEDPARFNRLLSGFHALFWWKFCGYGWSYALMMARISWSYLPGCAFLRRSCLPDFQIKSP
jgi:hypothetical protein